MPHVIDHVNSYNGGPMIQNVKPNIGDWLASTGAPRAAARTSLTMTFGLLLALIGLCASTLSGVAETIQYRFVSLQPPAGYVSASGMAINAWGDVVGISSAAAPPGGGQSAFATTLWDHNVPHIVATNVGLQIINDRGHMAGQVRVGSVYHMVLYRSGSLQDLGTF